MHEENKVQDVVMLKAFIPAPWYSGTETQNRAVWLRYSGLTGKNQKDKKEKKCQSCFKHEWPQINLVATK